MMMVLVQMMMREPERAEIRRRNESSKTAAMTMPPHEYQCHHCCHCRTPTPIILDERSTTGRSSTSTRSSSSSSSTCDTRRRRSSSSSSFSRKRRIPLIVSEPTTATTRRRRRRRRRTTTTTTSWNLNLIFLWIQQWSWLLTAVVVVGVMCHSNNQQQVASFSPPTFANMQQSMSCRRTIHHDHTIIPPPSAALFPPPPPSYLSNTATATATTRLHDAAAPTNGENDDVNGSVVSSSPKNNTSSSSNILPDSDHDKKKSSSATNTENNNNTTTDDSSSPEEPKEEEEEDKDVLVIKRIPSLLANQTTTTTTAEKKTTITTLSASSSSTSPSPPSATVPTRKKMNLMWCQSDRCVDVVRERVIGDHNQIMLNGPATGQVAYRWTEKASTTTTTTTTTKANMNNNNAAGVAAAMANAKGNTPQTTPALSSVLLLVRKGDDALLRIAAENVPKLTQVGINVLLAPDLSAKLKHYYGVDNPRISLFEEPKDPNDEQWRVRYMDDDEDEWLEDMHYKEPFPDLVVTLGGDGLLMHASMLFQGPVPPLLAISGGSLGFLTPFAESELVEAVKTALGIKTTEPTPATTNGGNTASLSLSAAAAEDNDLQVFPPNMPSYPYEPLMKVPHATDGTPRFKFGLGDFICLTIRMRLDCRVVNRDGVVRARYNVLNEVVIDRGSSPYLAALECFCDDVHLTTVQADGVIFATPTGSTAYSMAAGGSVVHPAVPCIMVTPICPHVLSFRSMVFPDHVVLRCYVPDDARSTAAVAFDGKHRRELQRGDSVQIQMSAYPVPTIDRGDHSSDWLESLKRSFNFNTRPRQRPL